MCPVRADIERAACGWKPANISIQLILLSRMTIFTSETFPNDKFRSQSAETALDAGWCEALDAPNNRIMAAKSSLMAHQKILENPGKMEFGTSSPGVSRSTANHCSGRSAGKNVLNYGLKRLKNWMTLKQSNNIRLFWHCVQIALT